jgi:transcriptional regulator with XRE-family HTH domain
MSKKKKPTGLSEQLRQIIEHGELSRYEIAKRSGVDASQLHRFVNGTGRLTTDSLDKIGAVLSLNLVVDEGKN